MSADVPATRPVALAAGDGTRCDGADAEPAKKDCDAATAEAALRLVCAAVAAAVCSAVWKFAAVSEAVAPIRKLPAGIGVVATLVAASLISSVDPSGRVSASAIVSPSAGWPPKATETACVAPAGPVVATFESVDVTLAMAKPNGPGLAASRWSVTVDPASEAGARRPDPPVPRSAAARSAMICLRPARAPEPFMISS